MQIASLPEGIIVTDIPQSIKAYQLHQLKFWGLLPDSSNGNRGLPHEQAITVLPKLIEYLISEKIPYSLSPSCATFVAEIKTLVSSLTTARLRGQELKDGKMNPEDALQFRKFLHKHLKRDLKEHQLKAALHLEAVGNGANFSVPGSGKTAVAIAVYERKRVENQANILFVVGPPACFGPWKKEFELTLGRTPTLCLLAGGNQAERRTQYFRPSDQKAELYLTTFQTLINDEEHIAELLQQKDTRAFFVLDEAHYIKQIGGSWSSAVLRLAKLAKFRCVMTGTPFPKGHADVFNLFDFLWPQTPPIHSKDKIKIQIADSHGDDNAAREILTENIGPLFYRVRKSELHLMEPLFHPPILVEMNEIERKIYDAISHNIRHFSTEDYLKNIELITKLKRGRIIRMRQCVSYSKLLISALENYSEDVLRGDERLARLIAEYDEHEKPAKLDSLLRLLQSLLDKQEKVVVWANFVGTIELISRYLKENKINCKLIYGKTPIEQTSVEEEETREKIISEFIRSDSGLDILIANPAACAESISLHTTCSHAIYYDLSYNCAQFLQSLDRIHRIGGSEGKLAEYHFLQYANSLDQDIKMNLDRKKQRMSLIIDHDYPIYSLDMFEDEGDVEAYDRLIHS